MTYKAADWGVSVFGSPTVRSAQLQSAIDAVESVGGGDLELPSHALDYGASALAETFDNAGAAVAASTAAIILRPRVRLRGSDKSKINIDSDGTLTAIYAIAPKGSGVFGVEIDGNWDGVTGAGHGIFQLQNAGPTDPYCEDFTVEDVILHDFPSYAIGLQNGDIVNTLLHRIKFYNLGADGIDSKQRGPAQRNSKLTIKSIWGQEFGLRLDGQAGVDCHGIATVEDVHLTNFGRSGASTMGVRFRTMSPPNVEGDNARGASLTGFDIVGRDHPNTFGIFSGSRECKVGFGHVKGTDVGLILGGNSNGTPDRNSVIGVSVEGAATYGFRATGSVADTVFKACVAEGCATGFRNEAIRTVLDDCEAPNCGTKLSTSSGASSTQVIRGSGLLPSDNNLTQNASASKAILKSVGSGANIGMQFEAKGAGRYGFTNVPNYSSDAAAAAGGLVVGDIYRSGSDLRIRAS